MERLEAPIGREGGEIIRPWLRVRVGRKERRNMLEGADVKCIVSM